MQSRLLVSEIQFQTMIRRLCHQLLENHQNFNNTCLIGLQTGGVKVVNRIKTQINLLLPEVNLETGALDITFFRDDYKRRQVVVPNATQINFIIENKKVIIVDDVLFTGRTIRAALDAMLAFGRPQKVELLALVDRRYSRHLPIHPDYVGMVVDTITPESVKVSWKEIDGVDGITLLTPDNLEV